MLNYKIFTTNGFIPKSKPIRYIDGEISSNLKKPMAVESLEINLTHNPELAKINSWKDFLNCTVDEKQSAFGNLYNMMFGLAVFEKNNPAYSQTTVIAIGYDSMDKFVLIPDKDENYGNLPTINEVTESINKAINFAKVRVTLHHWMVSQTKM